MSSQEFLQNRRKFLKHSALGATGALFLPSFLAGCTDHAINPDEPFIYPPLGDAGDDWNNNLKLTVTTAFQLVPDVGGFVSALIDIVWPSLGESPWDQVRAQVEALMNQKLADDDYSRVTGNLGGLRNVITDYKTQAGLNVDVKAFWIAAYTDFDQYQPNFQQAGNEVLLLPLFAQFANMYLALLRDMEMYGHSWGLTFGELLTYAGKMQNKIKEFTAYTTLWYNNGRAAKQKTPRDDSKFEPFRSTNAYDREMAMLVLDYMDSWPYYDTLTYPYGLKNPDDNTPIHLFTREIYSDPYGNRINNHNPPDFIFPTPATQFPTQINVWSGSNIDAVQLTYPAGGGPNGVTTTPRMGDQNGNAAGGTINILPDMPIIRAMISSDWVDIGSEPSTYINTLQFVFSNGNGNTLSPQMGGKSGPTKSGYIGYDYYALSSIYSEGKNDYIGNAANCIIFGFMRWPQQ